MLLLRRSAWLLLIVSLVTLVTGFLAVRFDLFPGLTSASYYVHTVVAPLVFIALLYLHGLAAILLVTRRFSRLNQEGFRIAFSIAWTILLLIPTMLYVMPLTQPGQTPNPQTGAATNITITTTTTSALTPAMESITLTPEEVARHNSPQDCWIIVEGKVYDVTGYLTLHPGGPETILPYCGKEATQAFATLGGRGRDHSPNAYRLLTQLYLGELGGTTTNKTLLEVAARAQELGTSEATGEREEEEEERAVGVAGLPEGALEALRERFPGGEIVKIKPEKRGGYEVKIWHEGTLYEVKIAATGDILEVEIED